MSRCLVLLAVFTAVLTSSLPAQSPADDKSADDSLPADAVLRIGSSRFRKGEFGVNALTPDGRWLIAMSQRSTISVLDAGTGKEVRQFGIKNNPMPVEWMRLTPDGTRLLVSNMGSYTVWNVATGALERTFQLKKDQVEMGLRRAVVSLSQDGKLAAFGTEFGRRQEKVSIPIIELATGNVVQSVTPLQNEQIRATLSPDGNLLVTSGRIMFTGAANNRQDELEKSRTMQVWDVATGKEKFQIKTDQFNIQYATFSPDGKYIVTGTGGASLCFWDAATGGEVRRLAGLIGLGPNVAFSADGKTVAASAGKHVHTWELATGKRTGVCQSPGGAVQGIVFTPAGFRAWSADGMATHIFDVPSGKALTPLGGHTYSLAALAFTPDGKTLFSASTDGQIRRWNPATGQEQGPPVELPEDENMPRGVRNNRGTAIVFSPDASHLAFSTNFRGNVRYFDVLAGREECAFDVLQSDVPSLVFSPDGKRLAAASRMIGQGRPLAIWDVATGQIAPMPALDAAGRGLRDQAAVAFSPNGRHIAFGSRNIGAAGGGPRSELYVWDPSTGKDLVQMTPPIDARFLAFLPDNQTLAVAGFNQRVVLWDVAAKKERYSLALANGNFTGPMAISPDGRLLALGVINADSSMGKVVVWELASGFLRHEFEGHAGLITALAFAPDGRMLATGGSDTTIVLWDLGRSPAGPAAKAEMLAAAWEDLQREDGKKVTAAIRTLLSNPGATISLIREKVPPVPAEKIDAQEIQRLIASLDHPQFKIRDKATRDLAALGPAVREPLKQALSGNVSAEFRNRAEKVLEQTYRSGPELVSLRPLRALEILERIGTPEARALVGALAKGRPGSTLTLEAERALRRIPDGR
ncbi:MAG TPA: WD40 repeat domain-containing protein [Gemmataceae bacterium]|nr:WD40 repeat domain-containing protein [Gemmataceae bacterium]